MPQNAFEPAKVDVTTAGEMPAGPEASAKAVTDAALQDDMLADTV